MIGKFVVYLLFNFENIVATEPADMERAQRSFTKNRSQRTRSKWVRWQLRWPCAIAAAGVAKYYR